MQPVRVHVPFYWVGWSDLPRQQEKEPLQRARYIKRHSPTQITKKSYTLKKNFWDALLTSSSHFCDYEQDFEVTPFAEVQKGVPYT